MLFFKFKNNFLKIKLRNKQLINIRPETTDYHELISVLSGVEYPISMVKIKNKSPIIFDVGAHIGSFTLYAKSIFPASSIYAFEPNKENFHLLEKNIKDNNFNNIHIFNNAISNKNLICDFFINEKNPNESSIYEGEKKQRIEALSLTKIIKQENIKKIDIFK